MNLGGGLCRDIPVAASTQFFSMLSAAGYPLQKTPNKATLYKCTGDSRSAAFGVNKPAGENPPITLALLTTVHFANNCGFGSYYGAASVSTVSFPHAVHAIWVDRSLHSDGTSGGYVCWQVGSGVAILDLGPADGPGQIAMANAQHESVRSAPCRARRRNFESTALTTRHERSADFIGRTNVRIMTRQVSFDGILPQLRRRAGNEDRDLLEGVAATGRTAKR